MSSNAVWFVPDLATAMNTTQSDTEIISYAAGFHTALSFALSNGFIRDPTHPLFRDAPSVPTRFPLLTFENVRAFNEGFDAFDQATFSLCLDAKLAGDTSHKCGLPNCGEMVTEELRRAYEAIDERREELEEGIRGCKREWEEVLAKFREGAV